MKKLYIPVLLILMIAASCTDVDLDERGIVLQDLPGYVAFNAPGQEVSFDSTDLVAAEDYTNPAGTKYWEHPVNGDSLNIECPTGNLESIDVTVAFSGSAVFGVDFNLDGADANGGTFTIKYDGRLSQIARFNHVNLPLEVLEDGIADGNKNLIITITGVNSADANDFAIGRGGTDLLREVEFTFVDID